MVKRLLDAMVYSDHRPEHYSRVKQSLRVFPIEPARWDGDNDLAAV